MADLDLVAIAQGILIAKFVPRYAVVTEHGRVVHMSEGADKFLDQPVDSLSNEATKIARRDLPAGLRRGLAEAVRNGRAVVHELPAVQTSEDLARVRLTIQPMTDLGQGEGFFMLVFEDLGGSAREEATHGMARLDAQTEALEDEDQDQQASYEEVQAANTDTKPTNDPLERADPDLQGTGHSRDIEERFPSRHAMTRIVRPPASPAGDGSAAIAGPDGDTADAAQAMRADEALRGALEFNRRLLDSSGDCIEVLSLGGRLETMSAGGLRLMEVDDFADLRGEAWSALWDAGEARRAAEAALGEARAGRTGHVRGQGRTLKGALRFWDVVVTPIVGADGLPEKLLCISRDVTEQRDAEERLREAATVVENMAEGFLILDRAFRIRQINAEGLRIDGRPADRIVGRHMLEAWPETARFPTWELYRRAMAERTSGEVVYRHASGHRDVWLEVRIYPVGDGLAVFYRDVTDRESAREEAARASRLLGAFIDAVPGVVFAKDREGRMMVANRGATDLIGKQPEAYLGLTDAEFLDDPDQAAAIMATDEGIMARRRGEQVEEELTLPDGRRSVWLSTKAPLLDGEGRVVGLIGSSVDITLRRVAEEALHASEAEFRTRLNAVPQMVWSTRPDGHHDFYNDRWYEFTGVPRGSTDGEAWAGMFHPEDQPSAWARWRRSLETGEPYEVEYRLRHRSGEWRWTLGRALPVRDKAGGIVRWMGTCTDIEDRKRAEAELAEALHLKDVLLHEVNHRVKNSLQLVTALLMLQAGQARDPGLRQALMEARGRLSVVTSMHQRLYSTSQHDRVDFGDYLRDMAAETLRSLDAGGRIALSVDAEADVVVPLAQAVPLGLIVSELVTNAIKYAFAGRAGGRLSLVLRKVGDGARIEVADDGIGLPEGFDPLRSGGLGMRIVTALIRQVRGRIEVASDGAGARFALDVPLPGGD